MGSGVFVGRVSAGHGTLQRPDLDGITVGRGAQARSATPERRPVGGRPVGAYFEAHIEQGPILEDERKVLGVVVGALGLRWYDVVVSGQDAHAGPTPMRLRKDALLAACQDRRGGQRARATATSRTAAARWASCRSSPIPATWCPARCASPWICATPTTISSSAWSRRCARPASGWPAPSAAASTVERVANYPACKFDASCVAGGAQRRAEAGPEPHGHRQRCRSRRHLHGARVPDQHDLRALRGRHQPQRDRERQARGSRRRLQCAAAGDAGASGDRGEPEPWPAQAEGRPPRHRRHHRLALRPGARAHRGFAARRRSAGDAAAGRRALPTSRSSTSPPSRAST